MIKYMLLASSSYGGSGGGVDFSPSYWPEFDDLDVFPLWDIMRALFDFFQSIYSQLYYILTYSLADLITDFSIISVLTDIPFFGNDIESVIYDWFDYNLIDTIGSVMIVFVCLHLIKLFVPIT